MDKAAALDLIIQLAFVQGLVVGAGIAVVVFGLVTAAMTWRS